jgi:hypothetical protein
MYISIFIFTEIGTSRKRQTSVYRLGRGIKRFFSLYRPSFLIDAYVRPEKIWMVCAGLSIKLHFSRGQHTGLGRKKMSRRSCSCIPLLTSPIQ